MTIKRKFLICGVLMFVALAVVGTVTGRTVRAAQHDQVTSSLEAVASLEADRIEDLLSSAAERLSHSVAMNKISEFDPDAAGGTPEPGSGLSPLDDGLEHLSIDDPTILASTLVTPDGRTIATTGRSTGAKAATAIDTEELAAAIAAIDVGADYSVGCGFRLPGDERYRLYVPVLAGTSDPTAFVVAEFDLAPIQEMFGSHDKLGETAEAHLVQTVPEGAQFITDLRFRPDSRFDVVIPREKARAPAILAAYGPSQTYDNIEDYRGETVIASVRHIPNTPWALVVKIDQSEAYAAFDRAAWLGLVGFAAAAVLSAGALATMARSVLRRVRKVAESASDISAGDLTARVGDRSGDELGALARAFDQMADTLVADMAAPPCHGGRAGPPCPP